MHVQGNFEHHARNSCPRKPFADLVGSSFPSSAKMMGDDPLMNMKTNPFVDDDALPDLEPISLNYQPTVSTSAFMERPHRSFPHREAALEDAAMECRAERVARDPVNDGRFQGLSTAQRVQSCRAVANSITPTNMGFPHRFARNDPTSFDVEAPLPLVANPSEYRVFSCHLLKHGMIAPEMDMSGKCWFGGNVAPLTPAFPDYSGKYGKLQRDERQKGNSGIYLE